MHPLGGNTDQAVETIQIPAESWKIYANTIHPHYFSSNCSMYMFPPPFFCLSKNIIFDHKNLNNLLFGRSRLSYRKPARRRRRQSLSFWMLGISWTQIPLNASFVEGYCQSQLSWERVLPCLQARDFSGKSDGRERERERCLWIYKSNEE